MWQNDDNKMEMNQGWNRGDDKKSDQQQQQVDAENDKLGLDNFDELLGAIGGCDNFMSTGSKMNNNSNSNSSNNNNNNDYSYGSHHNSAAMATTDVVVEKHFEDERLNVALFSENWGKTVINQEKNWDLPPPPSQPSPNVNSVMWSFGASVTGTEIWEYTVRNKTKALISAASATSSASSANVANAAATSSSSTVSTNQKVSQPWGHNSASHIGGTWGEEEDSSNVWTGVPSGASAAAPMTSGSVGGIPAPVPTTTPSANSNNNNNNNHHHHQPVPSEFDSCSDNATSIWGGSTKVNNNNNNNGVMGSNNAANVSNAGMVGNFGGQMAGMSSNMGNSYVGMKRDNNMNVMNSNNMKSSCSSSASSGSGSGSINIDTWGTAQGGAQAPRASGNGVDDGTAVWGKPEIHHKIARWKDPANAKMPGNSANGNNALASQNRNGAGSGLISPSPGMIRLPPGAPGFKGNNSNNMGNKGNSGNNNNNQNKQANGMAGNLMHDGVDVGDNSGNDLWNKQPMNRGFGVWGQKQNESGTPKTAPSTPNTPGGNMGAGGWGSEAAPASPLSYWGAKGRGGGANNWLSGDDPMDDNNWNKAKQGMPSQQPSQLSKESLNPSKVYRILMEIGCKREEIENALRSSGVSRDDLLNFGRNFSIRDNMGDMDSRGKGQASSNTPTSLIMNCLANSNLSSIMNRHPSQGMQQTQPQVTLSSQTQDHIINVQQSTSQQQHDQSQIHHQLNQAPSQALPSINHVQNVLRNQAAKNLGSGQPNLPSEKQLMHLVQQIQLAVQSGHLNAQILNQPLAAPTIHLINQLLQNIKTLQSLQMQIASHPKNGGPFNNSSQSNLHVQITQTKLRIQNLQNQITIQQGLFLKQQQQGQLTGGGGTHSQGSLVNPSALIYSQSNGDIGGGNGGNGGGANQSQQMLATAQSSHAQGGGGALHSSMVSGIGNTNAPIFNANHGSGNGAGMDFLKDGDSIQQLNNDLCDLTLKDYSQSGAGAHQGLGISGINGGMNSMNASSQGHHSQQQQGNSGQHSRLQKWKFNNYDRDEHGSSAGENNANDFLRAPGSTKNHPNDVSGLNRGNVGGDGSSLGGWSGLSFPGNGGGESSNWSKDSMLNAVSMASNSVPSSIMGPNGTQAGDLKSLVMSSSSGVTGGVMTAPSQTTVNSMDLNDINNLVPEFEPGKPWKGVSGMKIEDDPHITPGSVTRSPLSVNTIRDPAILTGLYNNWSAKGASPNTLNNEMLAPSVGLSSNATWAFNAGANAGWGAIPNETHNPETLWSGGGGGSMTKTRGPPPGMGQERLGPRGDQSMAGIRPQSSTFNNWMMNPSNEGGDHLSNGLEPKDLLLSRMMNNGNGVGYGMGVNIGNKWM